LSNRVISWRIEDTADEIIFLHLSGGAFRDGRASLRPVAAGHKRARASPYRDRSSGNPWRAGHTALTDRDRRFVVTQLEDNMAELQAAQLAMQHSQNPNVRGFAQKMITDHTYTQDTLTRIASMHDIQSPTMLTEQHRDMLGRLTTLNGPTFDRNYVESTLRAHATMISELNSEISNVIDTHINAWVQNTRPTILQHSEIAQQLLASLPSRG
jgi:putative membrane protein